MRTPILHSSVVTCFLASLLALSALSSTACSSAAVDEDEETDEGAIKLDPNAARPSLGARLAARELSDTSGNLTITGRTVEVVRIEDKANLGPSAGGPPGRLIDDPVANATVTRRINDAIPRSAADVRRIFGDAELGAASGPVQATVTVSGGSNWKGGALVNERGLLSLVIEVSLSSGRTLRKLKTFRLLGGEELTLGHVVRPADVGVLRRACEDAGVRDCVALLPSAEVAVAEPYLWVRIGAASPFNVRIEALPEGTFLW